MSYSAYIHKNNPACIVFLIDQSTSMAKPFCAQPEKKSACLADAINRLLQTLCIMCGRVGGIREFFQIGVISYGRTVQSAWGGNLAGRGLVTVGEIATSPLRVENRTKLVDDGEGGVLKQNLRIPVWFEPVAFRTTPLRQAIERASEWVSGFLATFPDCYPPLVMNISDGTADVDASEAAAALQRLRSSDGKVLLFNGLFEEYDGPSIIYPEQEKVLPNEFARQLFRMSSVLPPPLVELAISEGFQVGPLSRGFAFNADLLPMIRNLRVGT